MNHKYLLPAMLAWALTLVACNGGDDAAAARAAAASAVDSIAAEFVQGYYAQFPQEVYEVGYPDAPMNRFSDHSSEATLAWDHRVDEWLARLDAIDTSLIEDQPAAVTYAFTRERLDSLRARRVCRQELWNVSPTWTGWQSEFAATLAVQPVTTDAERRDALQRLRDMPRFLDTETSVLREGMDLGYLAPKNNVAAVLDQVDALIATPPEDSPFYGPASRSADVSFVNQYRKMLETELTPALRRFRDFLAEEYAGRDAAGVAANPDGAECYRTSVRYWSTLDMDAEAIHREGLAQMTRIRSEMLKIARESFGTDDLGELLQRLRSDPAFTFSDEQALVDYVSAAVERGREEAGNWFGLVPDVELVVVQSPAYEKDSGGGFYSAGALDGSYPATYKVGTYNPQGISKAGQEATAFHESYPGHHLQGSVALQNEELSPVLRFMYTSGFAEGWALYTERLADEMGLYSDDVARLGMLSNEAYRAARLVVDPGMHVLGWTRQQAIDYMLQHTAEGPDAVGAEVDRYLAVPGQATSYLLGSLEIQRLRRQAEAALGERFDIRKFHDRVLANGSVTLSMLRDSIEVWIAEQRQ